MQAGPPLLQQATVQNVENYLGWTLNSAEFVETLTAHRLRGSLV